MVGVTKIENIKEIQYGSIKYNIPESIYKLKINSPYDPLFNSSILHSLLDQYLLPNVGNQAIYSVQFFKEHFETFIGNSNGYDITLKDKIIAALNNEITRLSAPIYSIANTEFLKNNMYNDYAIRNFFEAIENMIKFYIEKDTIVGNIKENYVDNIYSEKFIAHILQIIFDNIDHVELKGDMYIFASGYSTPIKGHMISFLCIRDNLGSYDVYMFNSGEGIDKHNTKDTLSKGILYFYCDNLQMLKLMLLIDAFTTFLYASINEFYNALIYFMNFTIYDDNYDNKSDKLHGIEYIEPQLSGSCTYFSLFYLFKLLYYKLWNNPKFDDFNSQIQSDSINKLFSFINQNYISKEITLPYIFKSIIETCPKKYNITNKVNKVQKYYNESVKSYLRSCYERIAVNSNKLTLFKNKLVDNEVIEPNSNTNLEQTLERCLLHIFNFNNRYTWYINNKLMIYHIFNVLINNSKQPDFFKLDKDILQKVVSNICDIQKAISNHSLNMFLFLFLIKINENNSFILFKKNIDSTMPANIFKINFYKLYGQSVYKNLYEEDDVKLIAKYRGLFTEKLQVKNMHSIDITQIVNNVKENYKQLLINFILHFNKYSFANITDKIIMDAKYHFEKYNFFENNNCNVQGNYAIVDNINFNELSLITLDDTNLNNNINFENFINVMETGDTLKLNHLITDNDYYMNDIQCSYDKIYDNYKINNFSNITHNLINISELVNIKKLLVNLMSYTIQVIIFICALLIKNEIAFVRENERYFEGLRNYKASNIVHETCLRLINGCIRNEIVNINLYELTNGNDDLYIINYFLELYLYYLFISDYNLYCKEVNIIRSSSLTTKIEKYYGNLVNDYSNVFDDTNVVFENVILGSYLQRNYIMISNGLYGTEEQLYMHELEGKVFKFTVVLEESSYILTYMYKDIVYHNINFTEKNVFIDILKQNFSNNLLFFYNDKINELIVYFINTYTNKNTELIFIINCDTQHISVKHNDDIYNIVFDANEMYVRWIYQIPFCFIIKSDEYKILLIENKVQNMLLIEGINNTYFNKDQYPLNINYINKLFLNTEKNNCYIIEFNFENSLSLKFTDESLILYTYLCIIYSKSDCLKLIFQNFKSIYKYNDDDEFSKILKKLLDSGCNSVYNSYFKYMDNPIYIYEYKKRIKFSYNPSYDVITDKKYKGSYNVRKLFTFSKLLTSYLKQIPNADTVTPGIQLDKKNIILDEVQICINEYLKKYKKCKENVNMNFNIPNFIEVFKNIKNKNLSYIHAEYVKTDDIIYTILNNPIYFYRIIDINICIRLIKSVQNVSCNKAKRLYDSIDHTLLFSFNERPTEVILFEVMFGNIIRQEQYNLYLQICDEIFEKKQYSVFQLLMGKGKTSVILPLLTIKYTNIFSSIFIILPTHLIKQTIDDLNNYYQILEDVNIMQLKKNSDIYKYNSKKIYVTDSKAMQSVLLERHMTIGLVIIDEFDSLYDPLSSELNYPIKELQIGDDILIKEYAEYIIDTFYGEKSKPLNILFNKTYKECIKLIYNKDYGLSKKDSHQNKYIAVPYSAVNKPISGSYFSERYVSITLTVLAHLNNNKLRKIDLENIISAINKFSDYTFFINDSNIYDVIEDVYGIFVDKVFYESILNNNYNINNIYDFIKYKIHDKRLIKEYIIKIVIPSLKYTIEKYNCSFIDIINKYRFHHKIGFSGTFNIDLPYWDEPNNEFTKIVINKADIGSTYFSFLGVDNNHKKLFIYNSDADVLHYLISLIKDYNYNCLIDTGAFLKNYKGYYVFNKLKSAELLFRYIIRITNDDIKLVYDNINKIEYEYSNQVYNTDELFIYYDNQHTTGIDIRQPFILKGLITIDSFNKYTTISQGMYRLHNLNYGHTIDIVATNFLKDMNRENILEYLLQQDIDYKKNARKNMLKQNAKYLFRLDGNFKKKTYIDKLSNDNIIEKILEGSKGNIRNKILRIKQEYDKLDDNLLVLSMEREKEKEKEKEKESYRMYPRDKLETVEKIVKFGNLELIVHSSDILNNLGYLGIYYIKNYKFNQDKCTLNDDINRNYFNYEAYGYLYIISENKYIIINGYEATFLKIIRNNKDIIIKRKYEPYSINHTEYFIKFLIGEKMNFNGLLHVLIYIYKNNIQYYIKKLLDILEKNYCINSISSNKGKLYNKFIRTCCENYQSLDDVKEQLNKMDYRTIYNLVTGSIIDKDDNLRQAIVTSLALVFY